jgi:hypothetical protein
MHNKSECGSRFNYHANWYGAVSKRPDSSTVEFHHGAIKHQPKIIVIDKLKRTRGTSGIKGKATIGYNRAIKIRIFKTSIAEIGVDNFTINIEYGRPQRRRF